jgi:hypothetical protein
MKLLAGIMNAGGGPATAYARILTQRGHNLFSILQHLSFLFHCLMLHGCSLDDLHNRHERRFVRMRAWHRPMIVLGITGSTALVLPWVFTTMAVYG